MYHKRDTLQLFHISYTFQVYVFAGQIPIFDIFKKNDEKR
nr:MAG TPA: hypothetical protein [Caudoviricetes sp.]